MTDLPFLSCRSLSETETDRAREFYTMLSRACNDVSVTDAVHVASGHWSEDVFPVLAQSPFVA